MRSFKIFAAGAALAIALTGSASAATMTLDYKGTNAFGTSAMFDKVVFKLKGKKRKMNAGMFDLNTASGNVLAFSLNLSKKLPAGMTVSKGASAYSALVTSNIDKLFTSSFSSVTNGVQAAAFQLALWEIVYDSNNLNIRKGKFRGKRNAAVLNQAQAYLNTLAGAGSGGYTLSYLSGGKRTRLVEVENPAPVPLPASAAMLGMGVAGLAAMRRRKKATA